MQRMRLGNHASYSSVLLAIGLVTPAVPGSAAPRRKAPASTPVAPQLLSLTVTPNRVVLHGAADRQQLVVTGRYSDGVERDLTRSAAYRWSGKPLAQIVDGALTPLTDGGGMLLIQAGKGPRVWAPVEVRQAEEMLTPGFTQHVVPLLNKYGCAQGSCHGSFSGRGGFRVSLFGHDPAMDYHALVRLGGSRRVNRTDPAQSLLLRKPTLTVAHAGGQRFAPGSRPYHLLAAWIAGGGRFEGEPTLTKLELFPTE
ncbi:MAG: hypothetical protein FJX77_02260, partial [Armatimonadetes bacterium]|nr:hypothetical protein [Armatimonadota bacterium]